MARKLGGLILAGGQSSRMGTPKSSVLLHGKTLLTLVGEQLSPQVDELAISSGNNTLPEFSESIRQLDDGDFPGEGPLAGILSGLRWAKKQGADTLLCMPVDTPFFPHDLAKQLSSADADIAVATSNGQIHPTVALWRTDMAPALETHLRSTKRRSIMVFLQTQNFIECDFAPRTGGLDPFFNINTPDDLRKAHGYAL